MSTSSTSKFVPLLAASILGFAGAAQAVTVTMLPTWNSSNLSGVSSTGAATFTSGGVIAANSTQSWNTATDVGQSRIFSFSNALSVSVDQSVSINLPPFNIDNYIGGTSTTFSGIGTVTYEAPWQEAVLIHGISIENTGAAAKITFTKQNTASFTSVQGANTYAWNVHFVAQPTVTKSFSSGFATHDFSPIQMEVTLVSAVPEPGTAAMLGLGLAPFLLAMRRRRQRG